jgi:subtilisin family serine protease
MSEKDDVRKRSERTANIESLESRFALTAAPAAEFSLDSLYTSQYRTEADSQYLAAQSLTAQSLSGAHSTANMHSVFANYGLYGTGQTVAVIDSGIAYDHKAFGNSGYGAGYRVVGGWDFAENDANPYDDAPAGFHGTHVAGIIGSRDGSNPGVAQGVDLVSLRVFDDKGNGSFSWVEQALRWVHENRNKFANPITTVNLSLGTNWNATNVPNWATLEDEFAALRNDGIFVAVAAGNAFQNYKTTGLSYPAASQYVVPVGSVNSDGTISYFSQRHDRAIFAPGANIRSAVPDGAGNNNRVADDWATASGTSMATPYVAGVSTLVRQAMQFAGRTSITQNDIYDHLRRTADRVWDSATNQSYLRINVGRAIDALMPRADSDSATSPTMNLGVVRSTISAKGQIQRVNDTDYFTFTAGSSGVVRVSAKTDFELSAKFGVIGSSGLMKDGAFEFKVEAGKQYTITLGTAKGVGNYTLTTTLTASSTGGGQQDQTQQRLALNATTNPTNGASLSWNVSGQATVTILNRMTGEVAYRGGVAGTSWNGQLAAGNYTATVTVNGLSASQNIAMATRVLGATYDVSATGQTSVRWNGMQGASFYQVRVLNAHGQRVTEFQTTGTQFSMNLGAGRYTIAISPNARGSELLRADVPPSASSLSLYSSFVGPAQSLSRQSLDSGLGGAPMSGVGAAVGTNSAESVTTKTTLNTHSQMVSTLSQISQNLQARAADQISLEDLASGELQRRAKPLFESLTARAGDEITALDELFKKFELEG